MRAAAAEHTNPCRPARPPSLRVFAYVFLGLWTCLDTTFLFRMGEGFSPCAWQSPTSLLQDGNDEDLPCLKGSEVRLKIVSRLELPDQPSAGSPMHLAGSAPSYADLHPRELDSSVVTAGKRGHRNGVSTPLLC